MLTVVKDSVYGGVLVEPARRGQAYGRLVCGSLIAPLRATDMRYVVGACAQAGRSAGGDKGKGKFSEKDVAMADVD